MRVLHVLPDPVTSAVPPWTALTPYLVPVPAETRYGTVEASSPVIGKQSGQVGFTSIYDRNRLLITYGTPGQGQLMYVRPEEKAPFLTEKKLANPHSLSWHPDGKQFAVAATNGGSNGNGRPVGKDGKYLGNKSPIHLFAIAAPG